jgi:two-component system response regulator EvgA
MSRPVNALIVDDESHVRTFLRLCLKEVGIEKIWEADDGAQAIAMVKLHQPELVLLDINMPIMDGLEVLEQLRQMRPDLPVVVVTVQSAMKTVLECVRLGAVAYVLKHGSKETAIRALREALDRIENGDPDEPVGQA